MEHITPVLANLHWLPVSIIDLNILLLTHKALHGLSPRYISQLLKLEIFRSPNYEPEKMEPMEPAEIHLSSGTVLF